MTQVVEAARQGFVGSVTWAETWPGLAGAGRPAGRARHARPARDAPHRGAEPMRRRARRDRRARPAAELARGRARRDAASPTREPSPSRYPWQWYWDSCFAAIVWRRFDAARARAELESLLARPARRRLHRPHDLLAPAGLADPARPSTTSPRAARSRPRRSSRRCWPGPGGSPSATRPRSRGSPPSMDWLAANRDLEGDGLLWIVQPDESGLDASPKFDPVWGRRANARLGFPLLVHRNRRLGFDARRIRDRGGPVLCETAGQHAVVAVAAGARPALGDAGAGRAALGRAPRAVRRRGPARRRQARRRHLVRARAARPARPAGGLVFGRSHARHTFDLK